jgi:hypothetical protein
MTSETKLGRARLPREASPAKVAKDGQHNKDDDDDPKPGHVILSSGSACRLYCEPDRIGNVCGLRRERNGSRSGERHGQPREHHEVSVKRDLRKPANPQGGKSMSRSSGWPAEMEARSSRSQRRTLTN